VVGWLSEIGTEIVIIIFELVLDFLFLVCQLRNTHGFDVLLKLNLSSSFHQGFIQVKSLESFLQSFSRLFLHPFGDGSVANKFRFICVLFRGALTENREGIVLL